MNTQNVVQCEVKSMRRNVSTYTPSERKVGYSRAVVINNKIYISGTTSMDHNGKTIGENVYEQAMYCFKKIRKIVEQEGFSLNDMVVVRVFLTKMDELTGFDNAFKEYFYHIKPTCTLVGVDRLVKPDLLIEIECLVEKA